MRACHVTVFHTQNTFANLVKSYELKGMDSFPLAYPESPTVYVVVFVLIHSSIAILRILKYVHRIHILTLPPGIYTLVKISSAAPAITIVQKF